MEFAYIEYLVYDYISTGMAMHQNCNGKSTVCFKGV